MKYYNNVKAQAGMTLIELTVVLLVLIGLAGLLIPYVSGFVGKTHDSTGTNNLAALNGNFARFENENMRHPDNLESLINGANATAAATGSCTVANGAQDLVYCGMMNSAFFTPVTVTAIHKASLNAVGMQTVLENNPDTANKTFASVINTPMTIDTTRTATTTNTLAGVAAVGGSIANHLADAFGGQATSYNTACYDYIAFGVGDSNEMVGRTMNSAPIHFAGNADMGPVNRYNRFVAVYRVDSNNTAPCSTTSEPAKFVGSAMAMAAMSGHLWGVGFSAGHAYENMANNANN